MAISRRQFVSTRATVRAAAPAYAGASMWGRNQNLVKFKPSSSMGTMANIAAIVLFTALLGMIYLTQLSKTGSFSYEINKINRQKTELAAQRDNLKVENARLQSLNTIKNSEVAKQMTAPVSTDYAE